MQVRARVRSRALVMGHRYHVSCAVLGVDLLRGLIACKDCDTLTSHTAESWMSRCLRRQTGRLLAAGGCWLLRALASGWPTDHHALHRPAVRIPPSTTTNHNATCDHALDVPDAQQSRQYIVIAL